MRSQLRLQLRRALTGAALGGLMAVGPALPASGQTPPSDTSATGELLGNQQGAGVTAEFHTSTPTTGNGGGGGGGGDNSGITCRLTFDSGSLGSDASLTQEQLQAAYDREAAQGGTSVAVVRVCADEAGNIVSTDLIDWAPGTPVDADPADLAAMAREWLDFPKPAGDMSPPLATGTVAQLPTYMWIDNWDPVSRTATAGPVNATVTATPIRQTWSIDGQQVAACAGPGVVVEQGATAPADACGWTPEHSSAGQRTRSETTGEPCFNVTVTLTWDVTWTSNVVGGVQQLEPDGTSQSTACVVVAEVQAVVSGDGR
jgi:hypothetical protein